MPDYFVVDYVVGLPAEELTAIFNGYGAQSWVLCDIDMRRQDQRRAIFTKGTAMAEYLVVDYDTGLSAAQLEADLDGYGAAGWELVQVDMLQQTRRRGILMRGGGTGSGGGDGGASFPDAPADNITYGRMNNMWNPAIAHNNDTMDGGTF